jgi:hypothetical protein
LVPTGSPVRYPVMRAEPIGAVRTLSAPSYQAQGLVWRTIRARASSTTSTPTSASCSTTSKSFLTRKTALGVVLLPGDGEALRGLGEALDPLIEQLGDVPPRATSNNEVWANVEQGQQALHVLLSNDQARPA